MKKELYLEYLKIIRDFKGYLQKKMKKSKNFPPQLEENKAHLLKELYEKVKDCKNCPLHRTRTNLVFGEGSPEATLMFVGEAPGKEEDLQGRPFVGAAGKLLRETIKNLGISEKKIYIANILKCRPPQNRDPKPEEIARCIPYLKKQIEIIKPRIICTLGKFSTQNLLNTTKGITYLRGKKHTLPAGTLLIPTLHPAACIYKPYWKEKFLEDLDKVKEELDRLSESPANTFD